MALSEHTMQYLFENTVNKLAEGETKPNVWQYLVNHNLSDEEADYFIEEAYKILSPAMARKGLGSLFVGIGIIVLSLIISFGSFYFAKNTGFGVVTIGLF